jgi:hypothetical protein
LFSASLGAIIDQNSQGLLVRRSSEIPEVIRDKDELDSAYGACD